MVLLSPNAILNGRLQFNFNHLPTHSNNFLSFGPKITVFLSLPLNYIQSPSPSHQPHLPLLPLRIGNFVSEWLKWDCLLNGLMWDAMDGGMSQWHEIDVMTSFSLTHFTSSYQYITLIIFLWILLYTHLSYSLTHFFPLLLLLNIQSCLPLIQTHFFVLFAHINSSFNIMYVVLRSFVYNFFSDENDRRGGVMITHQLQVRDHVFLRFSFFNFFRFLFF